MKSQTTLRRLLGLNFEFVSVSLRAKYISEWVEYSDHDVTLAFGDGTVGNGDGSEEEEGEPEDYINFSGNTRIDRYIPYR